MFVLVDALRAAIEEAGGTVLTRTGAFAMTRAAAGWTLECGPTGPGPTPGAEPVPAGPGVSVTTERLVLACSAGAALRLLTQARIPGLVPDVSVPEGAPIARLTLAVRAPELDDAPVSQGLLSRPPPLTSDPSRPRPCPTSPSSGPGSPTSVRPTPTCCACHTGASARPNPPSPSRGRCATSAPSPA